MADAPKVVRDTIFISKATPLDDEFALWLAPRLEAAGYRVFCDILSLQPGDRWRQEITTTLQERAVKMLLCCKDDSLAATGVLEEIEIGTELSKSLGDKKFIIPLRLKKYKKIFGIGGLQYINFEQGWAQGLNKLLDALRRGTVPREKAPVINPNWEVFRRRGAVSLKREPERLTSNWLRIIQMPDTIGYFEPIGACDWNRLEGVIANTPYPMELRPRGILSFADLQELDEIFRGVCRFRLIEKYPLADFLERGAEDRLGLKSQDASNIVVSMFRQAWVHFGRLHGLLEYRYSSSVGFHVSAAQAKIGERVPWGRQGERRSSMLRNVAKGVVWQFGVTALPSFFPFPHFKLKSRVLFAPPEGNDAGSAFDDKQKQHRLRRSVCKGWRNKQWRGRILAFLELISADTAAFRLSLSPSSYIRVEASPLLVTSPVSTALPNEQSEDSEELDVTTLGKPEPEDVE